MAASEDLINFDVIESQKENIQALPSGRSAKKLAQLFSPSPLQPKHAHPTPSDTKTINDCIRAEYEAEVDNLDESDDPLDVFDRYVRWTLDAYPTAQATPQSQLHTLLERATKAFVNAAQYKNDPRYLKLWMHYIILFSDAPRETFMYLSRHGIGEGLAMYYEEYAMWLEGAGRWGQAEEVYKIGIEREARPAQRLLRKFKEFEDRRAQQPGADEAPSSPALPTVRPALAAKVDPFAASARSVDPQAPRQSSGLGGPSGKPARTKLAIFSDADAAPPALSSRSTGSKGWDSIGSLGERRKENTIEPKPWAGETLKAGGKKRTGPKMEVFKDKVTMNPVSGKRERIFVDLAALYPTPDEPGTELSFEEVWAVNRGWLDQTWDEDHALDEEVPNDENSPMAFAGHNAGVRVLTKGFSEKLVIHRDEVMYDENGVVKEPAPRPAGKPKKMKVMEVNETQIIKAKLDSPSRPKLKKRSTAEPTMTLHTKAATDDIYDIFNEPLQKKRPEDDESDDEGDYETDGDYTSGAESIATTRQIGDEFTEVGEITDGVDETEFGDETEAGDEVTEAVDDETSDVKSVSEWSDFSTQRHIPKIDEEGEVTGEQDDEDDDVSDLIDASDPEASVVASERTEMQGDSEYEDDDEPRTRTTFVPIPPEDYEPRTRPFRDPVEAANNRLPFMTPITERTESSLAALETPCRRNEGDSPLASSSDFSSPLIELANDSPAAKAALMSPIKPAMVFAPVAKAAPAKPAPMPKGPIIKDVQCNPVDDSIRDEILAKMHPPLSSYTGFYDHRNENFEKGGEIRRFAKTLVKARTSGEKTNTMVGPTIRLPGIKAEYSVKKELGAGAFAPVYLVENSAPEEAGDENAPSAMGKGAFAVTHRSGLEAIKMELPPSAWEFHMMRLAHARLGARDRAAASLSYAHEMHLYRDEGFLVLPYHPHGSLLDVVNLFRSEPAGVMDEQLAMFFTIELLRTVEALHGKSVLHGDLKPDNCLVRLDIPATSSPSTQQLTAQYMPDGSGGWSARGVTLIDFGRGIDMRAFVPEVSFIADWKTTAQDCAEMREGRPWTWHIDYHGLAGIVHCLLFGRYIETARADAGGVLGAARRYRVRESLKRYWQTDLWMRCFDMLLNPAAHADGEEGGKMPLLRGMRGVREDMEAWLVANCERGTGLKVLVSKVEAFAKSRR